MVLNRFIDELKHNSTGLYIVVETNGEDQQDVFCGSKGEIVHNVKYLNIFSKYEILEINPIDDSLPYPSFEIVIVDKQC